MASSDEENRAINGTGNETKKRALDARRSLGLFGSGTLRHVAAGVLVGIRRRGLLSLVLAATFLVRRVFLTAATATFLRADGGFGIAQRTECHQGTQNNQKGSFQPSMLHRRPPKRCEPSIT